MTVIRPNSIIGRDFVINGCRTVEPPKTTDRLLKSLRFIEGYEYPYTTSMDPVSKTHMDGYFVKKCNKMLIRIWYNKTSFCRRLGVKNVKRTKKCLSVIHAVTIPDG